MLINDKYYVVVTEGIQYKVDDEEFRLILAVLKSTPNNLSQFEVIEFTDIFGCSCWTTRGNLTDIYESSPELREKSWRFYQGLEEDEKEVVKAVKKEKGWE